MQEPTRYREQVIPQAAKSDRVVDQPSGLPYPQASPQFGSATLASAERMPDKTALRQGLPVQEEVPLVPAVASQVSGPRLNRSARRETVAVPETGVDQQILKAQDARERIGKSLTGKPWAELTNPERVFADLMAEGATQGTPYFSKPLIPAAHGTVHQDAAGNPAKALDTLRQAGDGYVPDVVSHPDLGGIGLPYGQPGTGPKLTGGYGLSHIDAKRQGYLTEGVLQQIGTMPIVERVDFPDGRPNAVVLDDGQHRAVISANWRGADSPHWLLTAYEPKAASKTSVGVPGASQTAAGPTPPATASVGKPKPSIASNPASPGTIPTAEWRAQAKPVARTLRQFADKVGAKDLYIRVIDKVEDGLSGKPVDDAQRQSLQWSRECG